MSHRDVLLSLALPYTEDAGADLEAFRAAWSSLAVRNPRLLLSLRSVLLLDLLGNPVGPRACAELSLLNVDVYHVAAETWGRAFNDAFLFAVSCDRARYWVHTDDAHICQRPFWVSARAAMERSGPYLWQLQLSNDWQHLAPERLVRKDGFTEVLQHPDGAAQAAVEPSEVEDAEHWPSLRPIFSLQPFVHNMTLFREAVVAEQLPLRPFDEEAEWAPLQWSFGLRLERLGAKKAILDAPAFFRVEDDDDQDIAMRG